MNYYSMDYPCFRSTMKCLERWKQIIIEKCATCGDKCVRKLFLVQTAHHIAEACRQLDNKSTDVLAS